MTEVIYHSSDPSDDREQMRIRGLLWKDSEVEFRFHASTVAFVYRLLDEATKKIKSLEMKLVKLKSKEKRKTK